MATSTLSSMRQSLSEDMGDYLSFGTSADGDASGFTIVASALRNQVGGTDTDAFEGWYILINDINATLANGEVRRIDNYIADLDNPTLRVQSALSEQIKSGITVELHRFDPTDKGNVIRQSILELYPDLYLPVRDETIIIDNLLTNSDFETFASSAFTGWSKVGSPTVTQETTRVFHGSSSAKIVAGSAIGQLTQAPSINIAEIASETARAKFWAHTDAVNQARINLDFGSKTVNGSFHAGDSEWELLTVESAIPRDATQVQVELEVSANDTANYGLGYLSAGSVFEYTLPSSIITGPHRVSQQYDINDIDGPYYPILDGGIPSTGRLLRIEGYGVLSQPTTNTGTTEIGEPQTRLVVAYAEMLMWRLMASPARSSKQDRQGYVDAGRDAASKVAMLKAQKGIKMSPMGAQRHRDSWHIETDSSGKILVFSGVRAVI